MDNIEKLASGIAVSSRVRLARNIKNIPFPYRAKELEASAKLIDKAYSVLGKLGSYEMFKMSTIGVITANALKERHLISTDLIANKASGCAIISDDQNISVMVNEEDHLREQCVINGLKLVEAYKRIWKIDTELAKHFDIAYDNSLGFLTACLTNLGTGMRASVMLFLPALTENSNITSVISELSKIGLTVRGVYGEGSEAAGCMYQISNQTTLGISEEDILENVRAAVIKVCQLEQKTREYLLDKKGIELKDKILRSYGLLTNALKYNTSEFMRLMSYVKLGIYTEVISCRDKSGLDKLILNCQPANIIQNAGRDLTELERDLYRAEYIKKQLTKIIN